MGSPFFAGVLLLELKVESAMRKAHDWRMHFWLRSIRRSILLLLGLACLSCVEAKLNVTKKKEPVIIRPSTSKYETNSRIQNKRFKTSVIEKEKKDVSVKTASDQVIFSGGNEKDKASSADQIFETETLSMEVLEKRLKSSKEFRKAYEDALRVELERRAVEISKKKASEEKEATQDAINRYSQVRDGSRESLKVETAGGE